MVTMKELKEVEKNAWNRPGNPRWMQFIGNRVGQPGEAGTAMSNSQRRPGRRDFEGVYFHPMSPQGASRGQSADTPTAFSDLALDENVDERGVAPISQVGEKRRNPDLRRKGSNLSLRDVGTAPTTPSARRQGAATPSRNAPTGLPGASNFDHEVEFIRGLNRSVKQYSEGEGGKWDLARSVDYEKLPGMGERLVYDSTDPAYEPGLKYRQDQAHDITLKDLENKGRLDEQALRNKGALQSKATTGKKDEAYKLAIEISKSLFDDEGAKAVDIDTAARQLLRLRELDEQEWLRFMAGAKEEHMEKIKDLWVAWGIFKAEDFE